MSQPTPRQYDFTVDYYEKEGDFPDAYPAGWSVYLPHQCGEWQITGDEWTSKPLPHAQAVEQMEQFCAQALQALEKLRNKETS